MKNDRVVKFNAFRNQCLKNAQDSLHAAQELMGKNVNHLVYHLSLLALEEIGQIFMSWIKMNQKEIWGKSNQKIEMDDHEKKLFYAIWGPSIGNELIKKTQYNDKKAMATELHQRRIATLYGVVDDIMECAAKMNDDEANAMISFVKATLNLAKVDGEVDEEGEPSNDFEWFAQYIEIPEKRDFVFGKVAQEKLIELEGDSNKWIQWLINLQEQEQQKLMELAKKEIARIPQQSDAEDIKPKWEINFKIRTPSHSIRQSILNSFNKIDLPVKLFLGKDNFTIVIKIILGNNISVTDLWEQGWISCKLFVASLSIGARGIFYWNFPINLDRYYDSIRDLENDQKLEIRLETKLELGWKEKKIFLSDQGLHLASMVYGSFRTINSYEESRPITEYLVGLGMLAKTDIHLRMETSIFSCFYRSFKLAVEYYEKIDEGQDVFEIGYEQIEKMIIGREGFDKTIKLAKELHAEKQLSEAITLTQVIAMKNYCDWYFITVAARKQQKDNTLKLLPITEEEYLTEIDS